MGQAPHRARSQPAGRQIKTAASVDLGTGGQAGHLAVTHHEEGAVANHLDQTVPDREVQWIVRTVPSHRGTPQGNPDWIEGAKYLFELA